MRAFTAYSSKATATLFFHEGFGEEPGFEGLLGLFEGDEGEDRLGVETLEGSLGMDGVGFAPSGQR